MAVVNSLPLDIGSNWSRLVVSFAPDKVVSDDELLEMSRTNQHLRFERNSKGEVEVMGPTGGDTGDRNSEINMQLRIWSKRSGLGKVFDSSTGFSLPNGALRSPDAAWVSSEAITGLTADQQAAFLPLCPDFVIELRSRTDSSQVLQAKLREYISCGTQLGWLIDPLEKRVHVYRPGRDVELFENPATLSGEDLLPGFMLDLREVW